MRYAFLLPTLLLGLCLSAQNFSGEATYKTASKLNFSFDNPNITPDQKKMIEERMKKSMQKEYRLQFNRQVSLYEEVVELEKDEGQRMGFMSMFGGGGLFYKDLRSGMFRDQTEFFGKTFLIVDSLERLAWKLESENKSIGKYLCQKATAQRIVTVSQVETKDGEIRDTTVIDTIQITAWYTTEIPVSHGPAQYGGLPGLILELNDGETTMLCTAVNLYPNQDTEINPPNKGEEVSAEEFEEITIKKMEEMRRMYGGSGRGRGSSSLQFRIGR